MTMLSTLTAATAWFTAAAFAHLLICLFTGAGRYMLKGLSTGFVFFILAAAWQHRTGAADLIALYLIIALWLAYLMFFVNLLNSVTLTMLARLAHEQSGAMEEAGFHDLFNEETAIKTRLADMLANGFIRSQGDNIILTPKAGLLLNIVFLIRKILSIDVIG